MNGLEGAVLIPILILVAAAVLYIGLINVRRRQEGGKDS